MKRALCVLAAQLLACSERPASHANPKIAPSAPAVVSAKPVPRAAPRPETEVSCRPPTPASSAHLELKNASGSVVQLAAQPGLWLADEQYALLSATPDASWADGPARYAGHDVALRNVVLSRIPKAMRAWLGRPVRLLGNSGAVCDTRFQRFALRAEVTPDPARREVWDGCAEVPVPPTAIADEIWRLSAKSGRSLVAEFATPCRGALLAVDPDLPAPAIAAPEPASAEVGDRAFAALRHLPEYVELQTQFKAAEPEAEGAWEDHGARRGAWSLALPGHAPLVFVSIEAGTPCHAFSGALSALWESNGGRLSLLATPKGPDAGRLTPTAVVDLEGTGSASVLLGPSGRFAARAVLTKRSAAYAYCFLSSVPFFAGPC